MKSIIASGIVCTMFCFATVARAAEKADAGPASVRVVKELTAGGPSALYPSNRAPLAASPLVKLPIGAITPKGWLRHQLELVSSQ